MRAQGGPQKLRFTIVSVSGEDTDYPARELLYHSPQTRGWQSPRFCKYPQELLFKLEHSCKIQQIQLLSHEYKIATKVEVFVSGGTGEDQSFKRLGYLSFDSNERSNHQARELKSVHVNVPATQLKLVVHRCHVNKLNIYNQVGLVALNLIGEPDRPPLGMPPGGYLQLHPPVAREQPYYNAAAADVADLNLDLHVDTATAQKIRELARAKDDAVAREDYDEAKRIKASIDRLKVVGQKIAQLEMRKKAAVEKEDYDAAKIIKADIDKLRAAGEAAAGSDLPIPSRNKDPDEIFGRVVRSSRGDEHRVSATGQAHDEVPVRGMQERERDASTVDDQMARAPSLPQEESAHSVGMGGGMLRGEDSNSKFTAYDERPAMGKGRYTPSQDAGAGGIGGMGGMGGQTKTAADFTCDLAPPEGWPADLPGPEPLTGNDAKEAEPIEDVAGEYVARAFYSKNWQLRDAAVAYLGGQVQNGGLHDKKDAFRTLSREVHRAMKDKIANVFLSSLGLFQLLIEGFSSSAGASSIQSTCHMCLPVLLDKLGDNNAKLRDAAKDSVLYLCGLPEAEMRNHTALLLKPVKNQSAWRPVLGVLSILQDLVPSLGISKNDGGFELGELMEWVGKTYNSPNGEVRSAAVRVTQVVHDIVGPALRKFLPKDINPKIKEQVDAVLGADGGASMAPAPPPAPAPAARAARAPPAGRGGGAAAAASRAGRGAAGRGGGGGAAAAAPSAAAGAAAAPSRQQSQQSQQSRQQSAGSQRSAGVGAGAMSATGASARSEPPPPTPPPAASGDDPAPYLEELAQREGQYGVDHPRVAETCSNLAILYNQRGDAGSALPLYERALAIYEQAFGPEHPDVAHTLTDLAVLHLEQGNDDIGRPLLERALAIQEHALGPDHPDVIAIKDVLNS